MYSGIPSLAASITRSALRKLRPVSRSSWFPALSARVVGGQGPDEGQSQVLGYSPCVGCYHLSCHVSCHVFHEASLVTFHSVHSGQDVGGSFLHALVEGFLFFVEGLDTLVEYSLPGDELPELDRHLQELLREDVNWPTLRHRGEPSQRGITRRNPLRRSHCTEAEPPIYSSEEGNDGTIHRTTAAQSRLPGDATMAMNEQEKLRLLQALQDDPAFLAQVRSLVLPTELLELPERFAQFASKVMAFIERQETINQRLTDDLGDLKGHVPGRVAREMSDDIAESMGFKVIEDLNRKDLRQMLRGQNPGDISPGVRRSFYLADLVARVQDQDGNQLFIAAEAAYTADERDTQRAIRNAGLIKRFTGLETVPAIVSRRNDDVVQQLVEQGQVRWFQLEERDLQPEPDRD